ncbi:MerR family transcriptional regulator (plasmid) [Nicoliella spurrieriana]|uniref:MerR family transcriptional regulator n=1 Tax=Nicoliella spurrieriana TaxID=2925830 RepID=A0A976RQJ9_9LACO|nr:MerR family transcriptional regulator [Nicoliella spurrieriana]UQS86030.1 MerR family transcriptional regulator [Nicoliella spurrieriana]
MLTVKKVAQKLNLTEYTVRYYTNLGLVPTVKRNSQNERIFDHDALEWLRGCKMLRSTGMSIKQIKQYVDLCKMGTDSINERFQMIKDERDLAIQRVTEAQRNLQFLNEKVNIYKQAIDNHDDVDPLNPNEH